MRQFRGKRVDNGEWVYGSLIETENYSYIVVSSNCAGYVGFKLETIAYETTPSSVGQATGLKDKEGVDTYEGDIFKGHFTFPYEALKCVILFEHGHFFGQAESTHKDVQITHRKRTQRISEYIKIIGNLTDNPDLMKEEA